MVGTECLGWPCSDAGVQFFAVLQPPKSAGWTAIAAVTPARDVCLGHGALRGAALHEAERARARADAA